MGRTRTGSITQSAAAPASAAPAPVVPLPCDARDGAITSGPGAFFGLRFGQSCSLVTDPAVVDVPLQPLGGGHARETWAGPEVVQRHAEGGLGLVTTRDHAVVHAHLPVAPGTDVAGVTQAAYAGLLERVRALGYPHLARIWNFVPAINHGTGDDETYAHFNRGRAAAFEHAGVPADRFPAATAVGSPAGSPLVIIVLASRHEPVAVENPRQVSAYHYPRRYGPRSPAFARATVLPDGNGGRLFISGTASIVGHESCHEGVIAQLEETLRNVDRLMAAAIADRPDARVGARRAWRVYLRNAADLSAVEPEITRRLGGPDRVVFLQADICRRELLVEIEGACELVAVATPRA